MEKLLSVLNQVPGRVYLLVAIVIFSAANSVTRKLTNLGAMPMHLIDGRNPISFCNVLLAGNLCALAALILIYRQHWNKSALQTISRSDWISLGVVAILGGALAPALIFSALEQTSVNNVVLIGRLEPPLILALSVCFLRERVNGWVVAGAIVSFLGVVLTVLWPTSDPATTSSMAMMGLRLGRGEWFSALGASAAAIATVLSKANLQQISLGIFTIFRSIVSTLVFFTVVIYLFGAAHFADLFTPFLWQWMVIYSLVIVVGGQLAWFAGLRKASAADVSLTSSFSPVVSIVAAYLILAEAPTIAQYVGGVVILLGIMLNQIGTQQLQVRATATLSMNSAKELEAGVGFKGV